MAFFRSCHLLSTMGMFFLIAPAFAEQPKCQRLTFDNFAAHEAEWKGRELVAFASWCSSCKAKILSVQKVPSKFVLVSVFEDIGESEKVLKKLKIDAPCIYGDDLSVKLGIISLPWSKII